MDDNAASDSNYYIPTLGICTCYRVPITNWVDWGSLEYEVYLTRLQHGQQSGTSNPRPCLGKFTEFNALFTWPRIAQPEIYNIPALFLEIILKDCPNNRFHQSAEYT